MQVRNCEFKLFCVVVTVLTAAYFIVIVRSNTSPKTICISNVGIITPPQHCPSSQVP
jgi:hypothetical protein